MSCIVIGGNFIGPFFVFLGNKINKKNVQFVNEMCFLQFCFQYNVLFMHFGYFGISIPALF